MQLRIEHLLEGVFFCLVLKVVHAASSFGLLQKKGLILHSAVYHQLYGVRVVKDLGISCPFQHASSM